MLHSEQFEVSQFRAKTLMKTRILRK